MLRELTAETIHDINAILTTATILLETIEKRSPNIKEGKLVPARGVLDSVISAVSRILGTNVTYNNCFSDD